MHSGLHNALVSDGAVWTKTLQFASEELPLMGKLELLLASSYSRGNSKVLTLV